MGEVSDFFKVGENYMCTCSTCEQRIFENIQHGGSTSVDKSVVLYEGKEFEYFYDKFIPVKSFILTCFKVENEVPYFDCQTFKRLYESMVPDDCRRAIVDGLRILGIKELSDGLVQVFYKHVLGLGTQSVTLFEFQEALCKWIKTNSRTRNRNQFVGLGESGCDAMYCIFTCLFGSKLGVAYTELALNGFINSIEAKTCDTSLDLTINGGVGLEFVRRVTNDYGSKTNVNLIICHNPMTSEHSFIDSIANIMGGT